MASYSSQTDSENTIILDLKEIRSKNLIDRLTNQYNMKSYCDVTLIAGIDKTRIAAHRNVLASASTYFNEHLVERKRKNEFRINNLNGVILKLLVEYCYTGQLKITIENIETLYPAVVEYKFAEIENECSNCFKEFYKANPSKCVPYFILAKKHNQLELKTYFEDLIFEHLMKMVNTDEFLALNSDDLLKMIGSDKLKVDKEETVFEAVMRWIGVDKTRKQHIPELFKAIRFSQMDIAFLFDEPQKAFIISTLI